MSRAVSLASASSNTGTQKARATAKVAASNLATLLACTATLELRLRPSAFSDKGNEESAAAVGGTGILRYLRVCATHLPKPKHPSSLHAEDHLTVPAVALSSPDSAAVTTSPVLGDVLVSVLNATAAVPESARSGAVWEAVSAVVLQGYEQRPLSALAAVAINGVSRPESGGESRGSARQQKRGGSVDARVVAATRALCVGATFVRAAAEASVAGNTVNDEESMAAAQKDLVAVFPAAMLAVSSDDKVCYLEVSITLSLPPSPTPFVVVCGRVCRLYRPVGYVPKEILVSLGANDPMKTIFPFTLKRFCLHALAAEIANMFVEKTLG